MGREISLLLSAAVTNFKRNKIRTVLTSLGIMIGVLSVVMLIALGLGLKNYIQNQFENMGTNLIAVMPGNAFSEDGGMQALGAGMFGGTEFEEKDVKALKDIRMLEYVVPIFYKYNPVSQGENEELGYIMGANEDIFPAINLELVAGEYFTRADVSKAKRRVVLGYVIAEKFFPDPERALGKTIEISNDDYEVVGVSKKKGDIEMDQGIFMPYTTTFRSFNTDKKFLMIYAGVENEDDLTKAQNRIEEVLLDAYEEDEFSVVEQTEMLDTINQIFGVINGVLVAIGSISLLVGGVGIMNIMYASVTERTKEVGIRRAIGATEDDILMQFLTESVVLSVFGGLMGLLISAVIVLMARPFFPMSLNLTAVLIAFGVSTFIGVFFGVFPARRAAKLPPIEAIRYE
jgi:putative ABC transport system permease protein